jgi:hypothetical protein
MICILITVTGKENAFIVIKQYKKTMTPTAAHYVIISINLMDDNLFYDHEFITSLLQFIE